MKKKILIIGKKSFIGSNLYKYFKKKKINSKIITYKNFFNKKFYNKNFDLIINCTSNINFVNKKYKKEFDHDLNIAKQLSEKKIKLIVMSTRKVYKSGFNLNENSPKRPLCNYSKNKLLSEINSKKILKNKILVLRISNIIGLPKKNNKKLHKTFIDNFIKYSNKGVLFENYKIYKDFISINFFCRVMLKIIKKDIYGTYNLSIGKKVYLNQLVGWLNFYNKRKIVMLKVKKGFNKDSFTLNNQKLMKKLNIQYSIKKLKKDCINISKNIF